MDVFEQSDKQGGKISQFYKKGFRFDTGPSLFTLPQLVDELLNLASNKSERRFRYTSLDIICRYFYPDGKTIDAYQNPELFANEIEKKTGVDSYKVKKYLTESAKIYDLTKDIFIFNDPRRINNLLRVKTLKSLLQAWKLEPLKTLHETNLRSFKNDKVVQLFNRYATYNGSNPYKAPATLKVIPHLEHNVGAFFPVNGMFSIVEELAQHAVDLGVKFHLSEKVEKINLKENSVEGLTTNRSNYQFKHVVSNVDVLSFNRLLDKKSKPNIEKNQMSSSAVIFYWGMKTTRKELLLHNILFSADYKQEFKHIFELKNIADDPTVYIFISSKMVKSDAPENCENWFVMINAPENVGQDWELFTNQARSKVQRKIKKTLGIDVEKNILFEEVANPETIESTTSSFHGSLYGISSNNMWAAFKRHPNYHKSIKGLYFVGGSVHPGGGIPLCLASAKIVSDIFPDLKTKKSNE